VNAESIVGANGAPADSCGDGSVPPGRSA